MNCPLTKKLNVTFLLKAVTNGATLRALNFWLSVFTIEFALALKLLTFIYYNTKGFMFSLPACLLAYFKWLIDNVFLMSLIKGTLMQIWKSSNIPVFIWKKYVEDFTFKHLLLFEICAREICEKFVYKHSETIKYVKN